MENGGSPATVDELTRAPRRLRHVAVVGARGHGKTALIRALAAASNAVDQVDRTQCDDTSLAITPLVYAAPAADEGGSLQDHLIHVIDTPGSLDGIMDIYAALALADGVVIVVDPMEGVRLLVEKVVTEAVARRKKLVLVLNSGEAQETPTSAWHEPCVATIAAVNAVIQRACSDRLPFDEWSVDPARGNVVVGSAVFGWGFLVPKCNPEEAATWSGLEREVINHGEATLFDDHDQPMDRFFGESVLCSIVRRLPSPVDTHRYVRADATEDDWPDAVRRCDPHGPLVVHIVRLVPHFDDANELVAIGRVLSGTASSGQHVTVITPKRSDNTRCAIHDDAATVTAARLPTGHVRGIPAGNLCVLRGVGDALTKYGFLTTCEKPEPLLASRLLHRLMREAMPPSIVRVTLLLRHRKDESKLLSMLHRLFHTDLASAHVSEGDRSVLMCISAAHLQQCLWRLGSSGVHEEISYTVSEPYAFFQETVTARSPQQIVAKSPNRHIRLYCNAEPLSDDTLRDWTASEYASEDAPTLATRLVNSHGWSEQTTSRIMVDPLAGVESNMLVDCQSQWPDSWHLIEAQVPVGFDFAVRTGVLCGERVVGLRVHLIDSAMVGWERHWGASQALLAMRTGVFASQLVSSPALLEAVVAVEINGRDGILVAEGLHELLALKRGRIVRVDDNMSTIRALVPSREIGGLEEAICSVIGGRLKIEMILDHYERLEGDPLDPATPAGSAVRDLRISKGDSPEVVKLSTLRVELWPRDEP